MLKKSCKYLAKHKTKKDPKNQSKEDILIQVFQS